MDEFEPRIRELPAAFPTTPATVIAEGPGPLAKPGRADITATAA